MLRVNFGLASLTLSILCAAYALHLVPDREGAITEGRKNLAESVAIASSLAVQRDDVPTMEAAIETICKRNPDIRSACVRKADGTVLASMGAVPERAGREEPTSTADDMYVPIGLDDGIWGHVEFHFQPRTGGTFWQALVGPIWPLVGFVTCVSFVSTYFYLRRVLRRVDPQMGKVVPDRVRDTLNTVAEGVLVLDHEERIALANDAFGRLVGKSPDELQGHKASDLPWLQHHGDHAGTDYPWKRVLRTRGSPARHHPSPANKHERRSQGIGQCHVDLCRRWLLPRRPGDVR